MAFHFTRVTVALSRRQTVSHLYSQLIGRGRLVKIDQIANWGWSAVFLSEVLNHLCVGGSPSMPIADVSQPSGIE